ncbi:hypothetical protein scyTo_0018125 [Scyliorhinus torazame]|uniref:Peptidase M10 metallopeptidase domain-containing protein n=1 Tax=Scyliorhinus torazame TaxID=75743 RepID=A0A401Q519_SCYTO|nr:hypothetical protein [Scyliorhinus torazame]
MNTPRCGVPDQKSNPHLQPSHNATLATNGTDGKANQTDKVKVNATRSGLVRRKRFLHHHLFHGRRSRGRRREFADGSVSGLAFGKRKLKWRLLSEGYSSQLSVPEQRDAIRLAFRLWSEVTPIDFEEDRRSSPSGMDITLAFGTGTQYWRYDSVNDRAYTEDPRGVRYPKLISSGFPGISGPINAASFDRRDQCIYFFQEGRVTAFNVNTNTRLPGYPKRIVNVFPPLVPGDHPISNLDAVYYSYTHRTTFFFKGLYSWRVANRNDRVSNPGVPHNALQPKRKVSEHWLDICNVHPSTMT